MFLTKFSGVSPFEILTGIIGVEGESLHLSIPNSYEAYYFHFYKASLEFHIFQIPFRNQFSLINQQVQNQ
jgi:hypothetical protein